MVDQPADSLLLPVVKPELCSMVKRDGVRLDADVHRPVGAGPWPVLLQRQAYGRAIASTICYAHPSWSAAHGYMVAKFGDEQMMHVEFLRFGGRITVSALPVVRYTTPERLNEMIALDEQNGAMVANPHVMTLEDGSRRKLPDADHVGFKHDIDPYGLLNPGKMRTFVPRLA